MLNPYAILNKLVLVRLAHFSGLSSSAEFLVFTARTNPRIYNIRQELYLHTRHNRPHIQRENMSPGCHLYKYKALHDLVTRPLERERRAYCEK